MKSSHGAIFVPASAFGALDLHLAEAMAAQGYAEVSGPPPTHYPAHVDEYVGLALAPRGHLLAIVPAAVDGVFRYAMWISAVMTDVPIAGCQRFMGCAPVLKLFAGGRPWWRDGQDADLEVAWAVPTLAPVQGVQPGEQGLPASAADAETLLDEEIPTWRRAALDPSVRLTHWALRESRW